MQRHRVQTRAAITASTAPPAHTPITALSGNASASSAGKRTNETEEEEKERDRDREGERDGRRVKGKRGRRDSYTNPLADRRPG